MTNREKDVLKLIESNPMISQDEVAKMLGITRSSVAVHISNLMKKGIVRGKGYVLSKEEPYVCVIGGSNIDIQGYPENSLILGDSNPGFVTTSLGGVGRNIAENLTRLGISTKFLSAVGDDENGKRILNHAKSIGLHMENTLIVNGENTSTYLCVLDKKREMNVAISYMDILKNIDINYIKKNDYIIKNSKFCIIDANLPKIVEYLVTSYDVPFILDTVSASKAKKIKDLVGYFHTIKPNKLEAEALSGIAINDETDLKKVGQYFVSKGVKNVFITLGSEGVYYKTPNIEGIMVPPTMEMVGATGAGDAFVAGLTYGLFKNKDIEEEIKFAIGASILAISYEETINPNITPSLVKKTIEKLNFKNKKIIL
ncbi:MAG: winged helix-turn-helix transcriptional regulator [Psychrilyobacter sp.]|nr:winged helix-turn-helix transcriptional regulator [Psychrilyobacter sp.]